MNDFRFHPVREVQRSRGGIEIPASKVGTIKVGEIASARGRYFTWNIQNLREVWRNHWSFYSPNFPYDGRQYYLSIQRGTNTDIAVWLYCAHRSTPTSLYAEFQLRTDNNISTEIHCFSLRLGSGHCRVSIDFEDFLSEQFWTPLHDRLTFFFWVGRGHRNGVLPYIFQSELREEEIDSDYESLRKLQKDLEILFLNRENGDVKLVVQGIEFPAHMSILRARSPVFNAMFVHEMKETNSGVVVIEDCDPEVFPHFVKYLYTGSTKHITEENVCELYTIADRYQTMQLRAKCAEYMKCHMTVETFCQFFAFGNMYAEEEVIRSGVEFFWDHAEEIAQTAEWERFSEDKTSIWCELSLRALSKGKNV